jgi:hypothetical protein
MPLLCVSGKGVYPIYISLMYNQNFGVTFYSLFVTFNAETTVMMNFRSLNKHSAIFEGIAPSILNFGTARR